MMARKPKNEPAPAAEHDANAQMTEHADSVDIVLKTCKGDVRDAIIEVFKRRPKPWSAMKEDDQRDFAAAIDQVAESLVRKAAVAMAAMGQVKVMATLKQVTMKDGLKLTLEAPFTIENVEQLSESMSKTVLVVRADASPALGERKPAQIQKDQGTLIPEGDTDLADESDEKQGSLSIGEQARKDFEEDEAQRKADDSSEDKPAEDAKHSEEEQAKIDEQRAEDAAAFDEAED